MPESAMRERFAKLLQSDADKSPAVAAIETLYGALTGSKATTIIGLTEELHACQRAMRTTDYSCTSVNSASELFMRFISRAVNRELEQPNFDECRRVLVDRGQLFITRVALARRKIATLALPFIKDGSRILTHSYSRCVCEALLLAASKGIRFHVYVTESRPDASGIKVRHRLAKEGITCTVIVDAAVAYIMENVDFVLLGAEGVVETGGILNKIGSFTMAVCARAMNKPVYALAESIKFITQYPLNQHDVPDVFKYSTSVLTSGRSLDDEHPLVDYTPPEYLKLLFTDLGILTPAAVSDELIKLYL